MAGIITIGSGVGGGLSSSEVISVSGLPLDVRSFGAVGNGAVDDYQAIQKAISSLPSTGGEIVFPASTGDYLCSGQLDFSGKKSVRLSGRASPTGGARMASVLTYTGTASSFIICTSINGFSAEGIQFLYNNAGFTGVLVNFDSPTGTPAFNISFSRCYFGGSAVGGATVLLALENVFSTSVRDCQFGFGGIGVRGQTSTGGNFNNAFTMAGGGFTSSSLSVANVRNPGEGWSLTGVSFEGLVGGAANSIDANCECPINVNITGCWFGDVTNGGTHVSPRGTGWTIHSNYFGGDGASTAIAMHASCSNLHIAGNRFDNHAVGVSFPDAGTTVTGAVVMPNNYQNCTADITNTPATGTLMYSNGVVINYAASGGYAFYSGGVPVVTEAATGTIYGDGATMSITQAQSTSGVGAAATLRPAQGKTGSAGSAFTLGAGYGGTPGTDAAGILTVDLGATVASVSQEMFWKAGSSVGSGGKFLGLKYNGPGGGVFLETLGTELLNVLSAADAYFRGSGDVHIGSIGSAKTLTLGFASTDKVAFYGATGAVQPSRVGQLTDSTAGTPGSTLAAVGGTVYATDVATLRNWAASLAQRVNALETIIHNLGLSA